jgi:tetrapyrrole methylase family protein / MazG family protein
MPGALIDRLTAAGLLPASGWQYLPVDGLCETPGVGTATTRPWAEHHGRGYVPPQTPRFTAALPLLIGGSNVPLSAHVLRQVLLQRYPAEHVVRIVDAEGAVQGCVQLADLTDGDVAAAGGCLLLAALPAVEDVRSSRGLQHVVERLLGSGGCPWDVEQDFRSLRAALLEEAYEVLEALDGGDLPALRDELGDLLIAVMTHSEMARQSEAFAMADVYAAVTRRLIGRHPHVFGDQQGIGTAQVLTNWEAIKAQELQAAGRARPDPLDGVPPALPALATAQKLLKKAKRSGFDWPQRSLLWAKLDEELAELRSAASSTRFAEELGDVLWTLADLAHCYGIDAETAAREATQRFRRRFGRMRELLAGDPTADDWRTQAAAWRRAGRVTE